MNVKKGGGMNMRAIGFCMIFVVISISAMENENKTEGETKTILKHQPNPMAKSPQIQKIKKVKTAEDIITDQDEYRIAVKGKRRSVSIDNGQLSTMAMLSITEFMPFIKEEKQGALKKQKSDEEIKEIIKDMATVNLNG